MTFNARLTFSAFIAVLALHGVSAGAPSALAQQVDASTQPIVLRPGDVLRIKVWPDSALSGEFVVEETGKVSLPLAGEVNISGRPISEIRQMLRSLYGQALKSPVVNVTPVFRISILGAVERPGLYLIDPTQTLFDLVSLAGGFRTDAKEEEVRIIRDRSVIEMNAARVLEAGGMELNLALRPGDRVFVPESRSISAQTMFFLIQSVVVLATLLTR